MEELRRHGGNLEKMSFEELQSLQGQISTLTQEVRELKSMLLHKDKVLCNSKEAMIILGVNNSRYLTYFYNQNLIDRRPGTKGYNYYKSELELLNQKIKEKMVMMPRTKELYSA